MSRNILNEGRIFINTITGGDAINISSTNSTSSTCNLKISKQTANTSIADTDLFVLETAAGNIKKITGSNMKSEIDTNFWTYSSPSLRPNNTSDNLLLGTTSNSNTRKLIVNGTAEITGNSYLNTISSGTWNGSVLGKAYLPTDTVYDADIANFITLTSLTTATSFSTSQSSNYIIGAGGTNHNYTNFNSIRGYEIEIGDIPQDITAPYADTTTKGSSRIDIQCRTGSNDNTINLLAVPVWNEGIGATINLTATSRSGSLATGASNINITANDINSTLSNGSTITLSAQTEIIMNSLFKIDSAGLPTYNSLKILNENSLVAGTNIGLVNNAGAITINATDTNTTYTGGTNITLSGTTFNLDTTLVGNLTWTGSQTYQNTLEITGPASSLGYINLYSNDNNKISLKTNVNIGSSYDIILPSSTGTLLTNQDIIPANKGGTGFQTYTIGDILYANTTTTLTKLAIGSANTFLVSNGSNPVWGAGYSFTSPLGITGTNVDLGGLSGFGSANQIIATASDSSNNLQYRTLTEGTGITITHTSSAITFTGPSVYWKRNINVGTFDIETTNDVDNIDIVVPFQTSSTLKTTGGLISGSGDYLKWVVYETNYRALESYCVVPTAPASQGTTHFLLKNGEADYPSIKQNTAGSLYIHFENNGDRFEVSKNWDYGHAHAKFKYSDPYTHFYDPSASEGGSASFAGSYFTFHNDGSALYFNTTSTYSSGNTNYFSFAKSNDQEARITMNGIAQISDEWTDNSDPSDRRIKYDIKDYENATAVINKIKIKSFMKYRIKNFNNDEEGNMLPFKDRLGEALYSIGVIAQELYEIPELSFMVRQSDFNDTTPAYIHDWKPIISLLVKSNQEQQQTINNLTNLVNEMKTTIDKLNSSTSFKEFKSK